MVIGTTTRHGDDAHDAAVLSFDLMDEDLLNGATVATYDPRDMPSLTFMFHEGHLMDGPKDPAELFPEPGVVRATLTQNDFQVVDIKH